MGKDLTKVTTTFQFCDGGSCRKGKSEIAVREARAHLKNEGLWDTTHTMRTRCNGRCEDAPTWIVQPGNFWYKNVDAEKAVAIVASHMENEEPVEEYLLFKEGDNALNTNNEKTLAPVVFKSKNDIDFGDVVVARSSASDQNIYPLFKKLFETATGVEVINSEKRTLISSAHKVTYSDPFDVEVIGADLNLKLAIGPITKDMEKDTSSEVLHRKVGVAEVIWFQKSSTFVAAIRIKNRKGKHLITINIPAINVEIWNYILRVYLNMDAKNPRVELKETVLDK